MNQAEVAMLENNLALQAEILGRYEQLNAAGAFSEVQYLQQQNTVAETRGKLMQSKAERLRQIALLDQQTAQLKSELADLNGRLCLLYTSPSPRDVEESRMPSSA